MSIQHRRFDEVAYAVVDLETTGFRPGFDEIVEVAVVWVTPGEPDVVALDTLIRPERPVSGTAIHGIEDADVADAPPFLEVSDAILDALAGRVVVGHAVHCDRGFLRRSVPGWTHDPPVVDTLSLGPLVGARRGTLSEMCAAAGIPRASAHIASSDAMDTARLFRVLIDRASQLGLRTFRELQQRADYAFLQSFGNEFLWSPEGTGRSTRRLSRLRRAPPSPMRVYYEHLLLVLEDGVVDAEEARSLAELQLKLDLPDPQVRALHAQAFAAALLGGAADGTIHPQEEAWLANLARCLRVAGWCPGD